MSAPPPAAGPSGRRRGRRPAGEDTRGAIVAAARAEFAEKGYAAASLRAIARRAEVDPALVHHYFDGKDELFAASLDAPANPAALLGGVLAEHPGSLDGLGARIVTMFLTLWDPPEAQVRLRSMMRNALEHDVALQALREYLVREVLGRVAPLLPPEEAPVRLGLVASQLVGLAMARYVAAVPGLAEAPADQVVAAAGPTLQRYLTGDLSAPTPPA